MVTTPGTLCFLEQFVEFFEGQLVCWVSKSGKFWEARIEGNQFWKSTCAYRTIKHQWTIVQPREHRQINIRLPERPMTSSNTIVRLGHWWSLLLFHHLFLLFFTADKRSIMLTKIYYYYILHGSHWLCILFGFLN